MPLTRLSALCCLVLTTAGLAELDAQSQVIVQSRNGQHQLLRNGTPYFINGAGGHTHLTQLVAAGGNSIRTWGTDDLDDILDAAQKQNLTVCVGLWLGHERHGFDYQNQAAVVDQLETSLAAIRKYRNHPAVLMWGIGNEMEGAGNNPAIWYAVDHIARECKRIDPKHPTMTVIAELGESKVQNIERFCPHIDIIGVNSYGGLPSMAKRYRATGGTKPYIVTEFGPRGPWEVGKTPWGSPLEASSTAKAAHYAAGYRKSVSDQPDLCLGSYAFLWGQKQETTATWFGMLLPDGSRLATVDAMTQMWTGSLPKNRCPQIGSLTLSNDTQLKPGQKIQARLQVTDPERDRLKIEWILRHDSTTIGTGGDAQAAEANVRVAVSGKDTEPTVTIPAGGGNYRLFAYVYDGQGGAAVANAPLSVDGPPTRVKAPRAKLPFAIYADGVKSTVYAPSGYMGKTDAVKMALNSNDQPHSGKTCLKIQYQAPGDWGGVLWQSPANDWKGQLPGGLDLTGAVALEFWARGAQGGETVNFVFGVLEGDLKYPDTAKGELKNVRLTSQWQKLSMPLKGRDLSRIKTGFGWSLAGQGQPITFYLDDIRYVAR